MTRPSPHEITQLLLAWSKGDAGALEKLTPLVHEELQRFAAGYMAHERPGHTLQTTALVNEAYLRLIDWKNVQWQNRAHFFGVSARLMRHILVKYARDRHRLKRGGGAVRMTLEGAAILSPERGGDLVVLDEVLYELEALDVRQSRVIEMRFFGGLSIEERAEVLNVSPETVRRDWRLARAWLQRRLCQRSSDET